MIILMVLHWNLVLVTIHREVSIQYTERNADTMLVKLEMHALIWLS
jgi:hypothetical protein